MLALPAAAGGPAWGVGVGRPGPSPFPPIRLPEPGLGGGARTACGATVTASSRPNPRPAGGPGGDSGAWQRGIWTRPRPPSLCAAGGLAALGDLSPFPGTAPRLPGMPRSQEPPGAPRPDFAIGGEPAVGAPRNASCSHSLRWVRPPPRAAGEGAPGRRAGWGASGRRLGWRGGGGEPAWPPLCCGHGLGESWSRAPGSPARCAPRRRGSLPNPWVLGVAGRREGGWGSGLFYPWAKGPRERETDRQTPGTSQAAQRKKNSPWNAQEETQRNTRTDNPRETRPTRTELIHSHGNPLRRRRRGTKRVVLEAMGRGRGRDVWRSGETGGGGAVAGEESTEKWRGNRGGEWTGREK